MTQYWLGGPEGRSARGFWGTCYSQQRERETERERWGEREKEREEKGRGRERGEKRGEALCSTLGCDVWNWALISSRWM